MSDIKIISLPLVEYQQLDAIRDQKELLLRERDALKAEVAEADNAIEELNAQNLRIAKEAVDSMADRDTWKKLAEGLIKEARLIESYFEDQREIVLHVNDVRPLLEVIAAYDAVQKWRGA